MKHPGRAGAADKNVKCKQPISTQQVPWLRMSITNKIPMSKQDYCLGGLDVRKYWWQFMLTLN